jgi:hypothetical protein
MFVGPEEIRELLRAEPKPVGTDRATVVSVLTDD